MLWLDYSSRPCVIDTIKMSILLLCSQIDDPVLLACVCRWCSCAFISLVTRTMLWTHIPQVWGSDEEPSSLGLLSLTPSSSTIQPFSRLPIYPKRDNEPIVHCVTVCDVHTSHAVWGGEYLRELQSSSCQLWQAAAAEAVHVLSNPIAGKGPHWLFWVLMPHPPKWSCWL